MALYLAASAQPNMSNMPKKPKPVRLVVLYVSLIIGLVATRMIFNVLVTLTNLFAPNSFFLPQMLYLLLSAAAQSLPVCMTVWYGYYFAIRGKPETYQRMTSVGNVESAGSLE